VGNLRSQRTDGADRPISVSAANPTEQFFWHPAAAAAGFDEEVVAAGFFHPRRFAGGEQRYDLSFPRWSQLERGFPLEDESNF